MTNGDAPRRGRRPASSRGTLEEAAEQLFLEQGYAATTVEHIAQRAGVSRATFFNYFATKSDVLWAPIDDAAEQVKRELAECDPTLAPLAAVTHALETVARQVSPHNLPLVVTQFEAMGASAELEASGVARIVALARVIDSFLDERMAIAVPARVVSFAVVGAAVGAAAEWARAGITRGDLSPWVRSAVEPLARAFTAER